MNTGQIFGLLTVGALLVFLLYMLFLENKEKLPE